MYPRVIVNLPHLRENVKTVRRLCADHGLDITGVTKVFRGDPKIAKCYLDGGLTMLGDSRVANLRRMADLGGEKWLIRPPQLCEVEELVQWADASLNSEMRCRSGLSCLRRSKTIHTDAGSDLNSSKAVAPMWAFSMKLQAGDSMMPRMSSVLLP